MTLHLNAPHESMEILLAYLDINLAMTLADPREGGGGGGGQGVHTHTHTHTL